MCGGILIDAAGPAGPARRFRVFHSGAKRASRVHDVIAVEIDMIFLRTNRCIRLRFRLTRMSGNSERDRVIAGLAYQDMFNIWRYVMVARVSCIRINPTRTAQYRCC